MTIKDIAELAGVSPSTVSKIMNGKDESIGQETREKVLQVAKEYHYIPYAHVLSNSRKFLLGHLCGDSMEEREVFASASRCAADNGYSLLWSSHHDDPKGEEQAVARLVSQNVEGVIWRRAGEGSRRLLHYFQDRNIPVFYQDSLDEDSTLTVDYGRLGYEAALHLLEKTHKNIACIHENNHKSLRFIKGVQRCFYDHQVEWREDQFQIWKEDFTLRDFRLYGITAMICQNPEIGKSVIVRARAEGIRIPENLSLILAGSRKEMEYFIPAVTYVRTPVEEWGEGLCLKMIERLEERTPTESESELPMEVITGTTAEPLSGKQQKKIVVVGTVNMDSIIRVDEMGEPGETIMAETMTTLPGGKGSNQAVGAAKLGANVHLIGKIGRDYDGTFLYDTMNRQGVHLDGVTETPLAGTGKAYILVQKSGESSIVVYPGANQYLSCQDVADYESLFEDAGFCLLQLESPYETVEAAAKMARKHQAQVILKPSTARKLTDSLLEQVDIFVPNSKELRILLPDPASLEEKAEYFLRKGVSHVIVTMGHKGCYYKSKDASLYVPAADFKPVDTTGAADAFIAALAVFLQEGRDMVEAISCATWSAGISITRPGVQSSMADRKILELYEEEIANMIEQVKR